MAEDKKQPAAITPLVNSPRTGVVGAASKYDASKYAISTNIYPSDLFDNRSTYGDNYVVFNINVPDSSKLLSEGYARPTTRDTVETGSAIAKSAGELKTGIQESTKNTKIGGETGLGLGLRQNRRITDSITLYTPNQLTARYSMSWDAEDVVLGSAAADVANAFMGKSSSQSSLADKALSAVGVGASVGLSKLPGGGAASALTGLAGNPKKEQLFKNVDFRTFNFEYQFAPRSYKESVEVQNIIQLFKLHMHPEFKDSAGFLFLYPSEFEITYYHGNSENMNLPRHTTSVLVDMSVNYTPQGIYNTFQGGASTLITMSLTFKELAILTKAEIMDGF